MQNVNSENIHIYLHELGHTFGLDGQCSLVFFGQVCADIKIRFLRLDSHWRNELRHASGECDTGYRVRYLDAP
jgi:hypothetical protein